MEIWDILDNNRNKVGKTHVRGIPMKPGDYHLVVEIWIIQSDGNIILTKRHPEKTWPNYWECTGGSVVAGENSQIGALREVKEEIGIDLNINNGKIVHMYKEEVTHYDVWLFKEDIDIKKAVLQDKEVIGIKKVNINELKQMFKTNMIIPKLDYIFDFLK